MHSSRMRIMRCSGHLLGRVSAWSGGCLPGRGGVCLVWRVSDWSGGWCLPGPGGVAAWFGGAGVCLVRGVCLSRGCLPGPGVSAWSLGDVHPPVNRITDRSKNITFPLLRFRTVLILHNYSWYLV